MKNIIKYCAIVSALLVMNNALAINRAADDVASAGWFCSGTVQDGECDGDILICPVGYYCPGSFEQIQCPDGKTSSKGSTGPTQCYDSDALTITLDGEDTVGDDVLGTADDGVIVTTTIAWEPNTININWLDADGNTFESTTCEYDGSITTPT
nr:hypothetical protein [Candidatus Enterousia merdequi]